MSDEGWDRGMHGHRKSKLHDDLQLDLQEEGHDGALLSKWVLLREFHKPDGTIGLSRATGTADGRPLLVWEAQGLLLTSLLSGTQDLGEL